MTTRLGSYGILEKLGAGGMGEVYRARDTRLNRDVAVKVLAAVFAVDPDRVARFEREAQALAALNHPNIAHIHGVIDDPVGLVMECVEGEDLGERIARGRLPVDDALPIARQIAEGLAAAHDRGIVHRDLKPANIKVSSDGLVKILDFGLAKAVEAGAEAADSGSADLADSPTFTAFGTQMGVILGTAAYMSPEQARGKRVDQRADLWAFGCVVYEMLAGRRTFDGETISDVLAAVLRAAWRGCQSPLPPLQRPRSERLRVVHVPKPRDAGSRLTILAAPARRSSARCARPLVEPKPRT